MVYTLDQLNHLDQSAFVDAFGAVFEHTPQIAAQAWTQRPFQDVNHLHQTMATIVQALSEADQLALIRAHPDLGSRVEMANASVNEQASVGLNQLSLEEYERFHRLNRSYQAKFGFPFIIAVKRHTKTSILAAFDRRLQSTPEAERAQAIAEILQIAQFRLLDLVQ
jgi:2-oxo-4-hydroxy-4-carboxy-5-ureidoimidazoline decarboxylase